jgi:alkyl sulfatase BDS1-like metallo-beta-lactamase superfamily hydrolase
LPIDMFFDTLGIRLQAEQLGGVRLAINWTFTDLDEQWVLGIEHRTIHYVAGRHDHKAAVTVTTTRDTLIAVNAEELSIDEAVSTGAMTIDGDIEALRLLFAHLDVFVTGWNIVEP